MCRCDPRKAVQIACLPVGPDRWQIHLTGPDTKGRVEKAIADDLVVLNALVEATTADDLTRRRGAGGVGLALSLG